MKNNPNEYPNFHKELGITSSKTPEQQQKFIDDVILGDIPDKQVVEGLYDVYK